MGCVGDIFLEMIVIHAVKQWVSSAGADFFFLQVRNAGSSPLLVKIHS